MMAYFILDFFFFLFSAIMQLYCIHDLSVEAHFLQGSILVFPLVLKDFIIKGSSMIC